MKFTVCFGVPLVWEKMADGIKVIGVSSFGLKKVFSDWSKGKALEHAKNLVIGSNGAVPGNYCLVKRFLNLRGSCRPGQAKIAATGATPMRKETMEYLLRSTYQRRIDMSELVLAATFCITVAHQWVSCGYELAGC